MTAPAYSGAQIHCASSENVEGQTSFGRRSLRARNVCDREDYSTPSSGSVEKRCSHFAAEMEIKLSLDKPLSDHKSRDKAAR